MKISELTAALAALKEQHGDITVQLGYRGMGGMSEGGFAEIDNLYVHEKGKGWHAGNDEPFISLHSGGKNWP